MNPLRRLGELGQSVWYDYIRRDLVTTRAELYYHDGLAEAHAAFRGLEEVGVDEKQVFQELEDEGTRKFTDSFDALLRALDAKR